MSNNSAFTKKSKSSKSWIASATVHLRSVVSGILFASKPEKLKSVFPAEICFEIVDLKNHSSEILPLLTKQLAGQEHSFDCQKNDRFYLKFKSAKQALEFAIHFRLSINELNTKRVVHGKRILRSYFALSFHASGLGLEEQGSKAITDKILDWAKPHFVEMACEQNFYKQLKSFEMSRALDVISDSDTEFLVYELFGHSAKSVRDFKLSTRHKLLNFVQAKKQQNYDLMIELLEQMIGSCPKHTFLDGQLMDATLFVLRKECVAVNLETEPGKSIQPIVSAKKAS